MKQLISRIKEQDKTTDKNFKAILFIYSADSKETVVSLDGKQYEENSLLSMQGT